MKYPKTSITLVLTYILLTGVLTSCKKEAKQPSVNNQSDQSQETKQLRSQPRPLQKGDVVAITCPASKLTTDIQAAKELLESWGLHVLLGETTQPSSFIEHDSEILRTQELQRFLDNESVKAVFAGRGGYGTVQIIDGLDFSKFLKQPKWLIGFSDLTVLHSHIYAKYRIPTIHGEMSSRMPAANESSKGTLRKALFGEPLIYQYPNTNLDSRLGDARGDLVGGNIATLLSISGSVSELDYRDKILFIEDIGEPLRKIDRMLRQLKRAGKLAQLKGLVVGSFTFTNIGATKRSFGQTLEEIIMGQVKDYNYPVCFDFPAGHVPDNRALILGKQVRLTVNKQEVSLTYDQ